MSTSHASLWRKLLILPPLMVGVVVLMMMAKGRQPPVVADLGEPARTVRVVAAQQVNLAPTAEGYGPVRPERVWSAVAQVSGAILHLHPQLRDGQILPAGTELLRIDPTNHELELAQAQAELAELAVQEENARASLAIEQRSLSLAGAESGRLSRLASKGTVARSSADEAERATLAARAAVQSLENTLALIPVQRQRLEARVARVERDIGHTVITAPFNLRVANLQVEADQFITSGQTLVQGDAVDRVEIEAQFPIASLRRLFLGTQFELDVTNVADTLQEVIGLTATVRLDLGDITAEWEAKFLRFDDTVDPETRTMGVVVAVDRPYQKVIPGYRPPLSKGMFVQVLLRGRSQAERLIIPRVAVRDGAVLMADSDNRLERRRVELLFSHNDISVIEQGLAPGERVVLSDLVPAVAGMLLDVQLDEAATDALRAYGSEAEPSVEGVVEQQP